MAAIIKTRIIGFKTILFRKYKLTVIAPDGKELCEGWIFENIQLHLSTSVD
jgi:hypothetical protein